jgi:hypothetical protein
MLPHLDTLSWFQPNQSLLFLLNAAYLVEKTLVTSVETVKIYTSWPLLIIIQVIRNTWTMHTFFLKESLKGNSSYWTNMVKNNWSLKGQRIIRITKVKISRIKIYHLLTTLYEKYLKVFGSLYFHDYFHFSITQSAAYIN